MTSRRFLFLFFSILLLGCREAPGPKDITGYENPIGAAVVHQLIKETSEIYYSPRPGLRKLAGVVAKSSEVQRHLKTYGNQITKAPADPTIGPNSPKPIPQRRFIPQP